MSRSWKPDWSVPPGEILREVMEDRGMTQKQLEEKSGLCRSRISAISRGNAPITPLVAEQLEKGLGVTASFWLNLESLHQDWLREQRVS